MNTGYTPPIDPETKHQSEIEAVTKILAEQPENEYWNNRLDELLADECACTYEVQDGEIVKFTCDIHMIEAREMIEYGHWSDNPSHWAGGEYAF